MPEAFEHMNVSMNALKANSYACLKELNHFTVHGNWSVLYRDEVVVDNPSDMPFELPFLLNGVSNNRTIRRLPILIDMIGEYITYLTLSPLGEVFHGQLSNMDSIRTGPDKSQNSRAYMSYGVSVLEPQMDNSQDVFRLMCLNGWNGKPNAAKEDADFLFSQLDLDKPEIDVHARPGRARGFFNRTADLDRQSQAFMAEHKRKQTEELNRLNGHKRIIDQTVAKLTDQLEGGCGLKYAEEFIAHVLQNLEGRIELANMSLQNLSSKTGESGYSYKDVAEYNTWVKTKKTEMDTRFAGDWYKTLRRRLENDKQSLKSLLDEYVNLIKSVEEHQAQPTDIFLNTGKTNAAYHISAQGYAGRIIINLDSDKIRSVIKDMQIDDPNLFEKLINAMKQPLLKGEEKLSDVATVEMVNVEIGKISLKAIELDVDLDAFYHALCSDLKIRDRLLLELAIDQAIPAWSYSILAQKDVVGINLFSKHDDLSDRGLYARIGQILEKASKRKGACEPVSYNTPEVTFLFTELGISINGLEEVHDYKAAYNIVQNGPTGVTIHPIHHLQLNMDWKVRDIINDDIHTRELFALGRTFKFIEVDQPSTAHSLSLTANMPVWLNLTGASGEDVPLIGDKTLADIRMRFKSVTGDHLGILIRRLHIETSRFVEDGKHFIEFLLDKQLEKDENANAATVDERVITLEGLVEKYKGDVKYSEEINVYLWEIDFLKDWKSRLLAGPDEISPIT